MSSKEPTDDELICFEDTYRQYESGYYFEDEEHFGNILISQKMFDKYKLDEDAVTIEEWFKENDCDKNTREEYKSYSHSILLDHCSHFCRTLDGEESKSPHGDVIDSDFVMWWNDLPKELLEEPEEDVKIVGWRDG